MSWQLDILADSGTITLDEDDFINTPSWRSEPSAITSWECTVPWRPSLEDHALSEARIYYDGQLLLRGDVLSVESDDGRGTTRITGDDTIQRLKRGGETVTYQSIKAHNAIEDYCSTYLDGWNCTVTPPNPETVDEGKVVQSASTSDPDWSQHFNFPSDSPLKVDSNDALTMSQTLLFKEAEAPTSAYVTSVDGASGGECHAMASTSDDVTFTFNLDYKIPSDNWNLLGRWEIPPDPDNSYGVERTVECNGNSSTVQLFDNFGQLAYDDTKNWYWARDDGRGRGFPLEGEVTVTLTPTGSSTDNLYLDCVALYDEAYYSDYHFDTSDADSNDTIGGPQLYPDTRSFTSSVYNESWNVTAGEIAVTWENVNDGASLALSNNGGSSFDVSGSVGENPVSGEFNDFGSKVQSKVTLEADGSGRTTSPRNGYKVTRITEYEVNIDTDSLSIIENKEYTGSHFENLQRLHDDANMVFVPQYSDGGSYALESFKAGDITDTADWVTLDHTRRKDLSEYANKQKVFGAEDSNGNRLVAETSADQEIANKGEIPAPPAYTNLDSVDQLRNEAQSKLADRLASDKLTGDVEIVPKPLTVGYAYEVPELDNEVLPLWSVSFDASSGSGTLEFGEVDDLAAAFSALQSDIIEQR